MNDTTTLAYVTLFAPLVASGLIAAFSLRNKILATILAWAGIGAGLVCSLMMLSRALGHGHDGGGAFLETHEIVWLEAGGVSMKFGVMVDALSALMSLIVTGVGACIFVFSRGYMREEDAYPRYFACLSLFAFSMLGIVFSTNLVETFIFWELVGVSSYSLIGYYFAKPAAVEASKKAFLTNRIGDFGMTCGILLIFFTLAKADIPGVDPTFTFTALAKAYNAGLLDHLSGELGVGALLVFTGALAKSAQVPLHVWLPDAMEGPTPVSALMHAATMVAAGVYLVCRTFFLFAPFPEALQLIAIIGGLTAFMAATMAFVQDDCKKVLAYSTLSQLGFMVMALGLGSPTAAMFHLATHACFKALLFLCAGSVIHGCHHEQDMTYMGGLRKKMPVTATCYAIGALALAGIAPLSGFFSKDAILGAASEQQGAMQILYWAGLCVAFMTACYMGRAWFKTFCGAYRGPRPHDPHAHAAPAVAVVHAAHGHGHAAGHSGGGSHHAAPAHGAGDAHAAHAPHGDHGHHGGEPHESPLIMTGPLMVLALASVAAGLLNLPANFIVGKDLLGHALTGTPDAPCWFPAVKPEVFHWSVAIGGTVAALVGIFVAYMFHQSKAWSVDAFVASIRPFHRLVSNRYYIDDIYLWIVKNIQQRIAEICDVFEKHILKGLVMDTGVAGGTQWFGRQVRLPLDGHLHSYVSVALVGVLFVVVLVLSVLR